MRAGAYITLRTEPARKVEGACEVCGRAPTSHSCPLCGRGVCEEDWAGGHCVACEATLCELCRRRLSVGYCAVCGRLVCEECSVEEGVVRLCAECYARRTT